MSIEPVSSPSHVRASGARALQQQLYREIGVSAVAVALQDVLSYGYRDSDVVSLEPREHTPAMLVRHKDAA